LHTTLNLLRSILDIHKIIRDIQLIEKAISFCIYQE